MINAFKILFLLLYVFSSSVFSAEKHYFSNPQDLPEDQLKLYQEIRSTLNDWTGEYEKLLKSKEMIESLIENQPRFLPVYIEKARYTISMGYSGNNNSREYNKIALDILQDIQAMNSKYPKSYVLAGHVYTNLGEYSSARNSLLIADKLGTSDPWLHINWATLLIIERNYKEALEQSIKALIISGENQKALVSAITDIQKLSSKQNTNNNNIDIINTIFHNFNEPVKRIRIAERLIRAYSGRKDILSLAYQIIIRQKQELPDLVECDVEMANLILTNGYKHTKYYVRKFTNKSLVDAKNLLIPIQRNQALKNRVFNMLFEIYLSEEDYKSASLMIEDAQKNGISAKFLQYNHALLQYHLGEYEASIDIFNKLIKSDISYTDDIVLMSAYDRLGNIDKLEEYHLRQIDRNPNGAWSIGNYASFLLFRKKDSKSAIIYGNQALNSMRYPMAKNITGLAYQIEAAKMLKLDKKDKAYLLYEKSIKAGVSERYTKRNCLRYCKEIRILAKDFKLKQYENANSI